MWRSGARRPAGAAAGLRHYHCDDAACGWQGLLPRLPRLQAGAGRRRRRTWFVPLRRWMEALRHWAGPGLAFTLLAAVAGVMQLAPRPEPGPPRLAAGETFEGLPLPAVHPLKVRWAERLKAPEAASAPPLALRRHCLWGKPGGNPYRGTVEQALEAAALPPEVVRLIAAQVRVGKPADQLVIDRDGIRALGSGRVFDPASMAMTYGLTLCVGTRVNFTDGHTEPAALYEAADAAGRVYAVMVPKVCGNVTVIAEPRRRAGGGGSLPVVLAAADPLEQDHGFRVTNLVADPAAAASAPRPLPEPGTLTLSGLALAGLVALRLFRGRGKGD
ncbi:conserved hypothetical protein [Rubrivivax sp. A210]|nr:conserved hypothetical protein [Rubrivivax sp. A210]